MNDAPAPLAPAAIAPLLRPTMATLTAEVEALSAAALAWHPAPGEWCVKEVLGHLIETERRGSAGRIRIILDSHEARLETWNQNVVAVARGDCQRDTRALLGELAAMRQDSVRLVDRLAATDLARGGTPPSAISPWPTSSTCGSATTATTSAKSSPTSRPRSGRTRATPRSSRQPEAGCVWQRRPIESTRSAMERTEVKSQVLDKMPGLDGDHHEWRRNDNGSSRAIRDAFASTARG